MIIIEVIVILALWFFSGQAIEKIYTKAGFINTPKFIFWLPALNLALLLHLAFAKWPMEQE
jgi:hypothetical protein